MANPASTTAVEQELARIVQRRAIGDYTRHVLLCVGGDCAPSEEALVSWEFLKRRLNELGLVALALLIASLALTPLRTVFGWTWPIRVRRTVWLLAFFYATLHVSVYAGLYQAFDWRAIAGSMRGDLVYDTRNVVDAASVTGAGLRLERLGRS